MEMLIRDVLEQSEKNYAEIIAVKWLKKKEIFEWREEKPLLAKEKNYE